jgi:hypothetical protein
MSVNQLSKKQKAAARINGAKSQGPVSVEGRARSSQNSLRHGLSSAVVVLPHEDRAHFEQLRESYLESFGPTDQPQHDLVETMAAARWRLNRLFGIESKLFEKEMVLRAEEMAEKLEEMTEPDKLAWVFDHMANHGKSIALLIRYEGSLNRTYERAFKQLQQLQKSQQNEPKPTVAQALMPAAPALMPVQGPTEEPLINPANPPDITKTTPGQLPPEESA